MNRTLVRVALVAALIAPDAWTAGAQTTPGPGQSAPPKGTATVRGRITAADTGRGLRRAQVSISGGDLPQRRTAATNIRGEFELRDLPPGRYTVSAARSGYLAFEYGQRRPGERGKALEISEGDAMTAVDIALPRASVISGRVLDENGEAVPAVSIWVMRQEFFRGRRQLVPATVGVRTDDTGQYRATGLGAGDYLVFATVRETWVTPGPKRQVFGYAPTYYPGTISAAEAQHVKVTAGRESSNVDIALIAAPAANISGTARRSDGAPLTGASIGLTQQVIGPAGSSFSGITSATVDADGSWRLRDVPAGEYQLEFSSVDRTRTPETGSMKVIVQGADIDGVSLVTEAPVRISGEVVTESGAALPQATAGRLRVSIEATGDRRPTPVPAGDDNGLVKTDGSFTLASPPGPAIVRVSSLPRGWALKGVEIGAREAPDGAIELKSGETLDRARIVLTDRFPAVTGRVIDDRATDAEGIVVLFPADETRWLTATAGIRSGRADQKGIFRFETVPPGDYLIAALDAVQNWQVNDPEFLGELKPHAERLTLREGASAQVTLRLKK